MASDTFALDLAFAPKQRGGVSPLNMALQSMLQDQSRARSEEAMAARQERALAAQTELQRMAGQQAGDRQIALENLDAKNRAEAVALAEKSKVEADIEEAKNAALAIGEDFEDDPEKSMAVRGAKARQFVAKANANAYKQKLDLVKKNEKEIKDLEKQLEDESQNPVSISTQALYAAALKNPGIQAQLNDAQKAELAAGKFPKLTDEQKFIVPEILEKVREELVAGEQAGRVMRLRAIQERQRAAVSRNNVDNQELQRMGTQFKPYNLFSKPVQEAPDSGIGQYGAAIGVAPRSASTDGGQALDVSYPDESMPDASAPAVATNPEIAIPVPQATGLIPMVGRAATGVANRVGSIFPTEADAERNRINAQTSFEDPVLGDIGRSLLSLFYAPAGGYERPEVRHPALPLPNRGQTGPAVYDPGPVIPPMYYPSPSDFISTDAQPMANPAVISLEEILRRLPPPESFTVPDMALPIR